MFIIKDELIKNAFLKCRDQYSDHPIYTCNKADAKRYETRDEAEMAASQLSHSKVIDEGEN